MAVGTDLKHTTPVTALVGDERIRVEQDDTEKMATPDQFVDLVVPELEAAPVDAVAAAGTLTSDNTNVADGATVTIGGKTYTFKTELTPEEGEVLIGEDADGSLTNLVSAINHEGTPDTDYSCAEVHPTVSAAAVASHATELTALTPGAAGNAIATTETSTHLSFGGATLSGGIDGTPGTKNHFAAFEGQPYFCAEDATITTAGAWKKLTLEAL